MMTLKVCCHYSAPDRGAEYYNERVCVCVCACVRACVCLSVRLSVHNHIFGTTRRSIYLWRRIDTLCTSGFMDDVIFAHKPRLLDVATRLKCCARAALG